MALTQVAGGMLAGSITSSQISSVAASTLTGTQTIPKATLPTGSVLQVVQGTYSTTTSNSTSTYADTGLTATITPSSTTSKILVFVYHSENHKSAANAGNDLGINLLRNGTQIALISYDLGYTGTAINLYFSAAGSYYDSPASTSALTYKTQFRNTNANAAAVIVQENNVPSTITLMEIAA